MFRLAASLSLVPFLRPPSEFKFVAIPASCNALQRRSGTSNLRHQYPTSLMIMAKDVGCWRCGWSIVCALGVDASHLFVDGNRLTYSSSRAHFAMVLGSAKSFKLQQGCPLLHKHFCSMSPMHPPTVAHF